MSRPKNLREQFSNLNTLGHRLLFHSLARLKGQVHWRDHHDGNNRQRRYTQQQRQNGHRGDRPVTEHCSKAIPMLDVWQHRVTDRHETLFRELFVDGFDHLVQHVDNVS